MTATYRMLVGWSSRAPRSISEMLLCTQIVGALSKLSEDSFILFFFKRRLGLSLAMLGTMAMMLELT